MPRSPDQKAINGYVIDTIHDKWHRECAAQGTTVSAALEVIGEDLGEIMTKDRVDRMRLKGAARRRRNRLGKSLT